MNRIIRMGLAPLALAALACGGPARSSDKGTDDALSRDLALAGAPRSDLELAASAKGKVDVVSPLERGTRRAPVRQSTGSALRPLTRPVSMATHRPSRTAPMRVASAPVESAAPVETATSVSAEPSVTPSAPAPAPVAEPTPDPTPAPTRDRGDDAGGTARDGGQGGGSAIGGILGGIFGAVIRGGSAGPDRCDRRGRGGRGSGPGRFPMPGGDFPRGGSIPINPIFGR
ncbi:MAG: hypothetical protein M3068_15385 [Gemmatimonadota bacterium]|nr:hypothetical protein [Gemmatimonadota bacterium]